MVHFSGLRAAITRPWARQDAIAMDRPAVGHGPAVARTLKRASAFSRRRARNLLFASALLVRLVCASPALVAETARGPWTVSDCD